jgi:hypothetical protein
MNYPQKKGSRRKTKETTAVCQLSTTDWNYLESYMEHIHRIYSIFLVDDLPAWIENFNKRHQILKKHQCSNALPETPPRLTPTDVLLLLVLKVGEACVCTAQGVKRLAHVGDGLVASNSIYCEEIARMTKSHDGGGELHDAQRLLLAGLYNASIGRGDDSDTQFKAAGSVLKCLLENHNILLECGIDERLQKIAVDVDLDTELIRKQLEQHRLASEGKMRDLKQRQMVMAAWACLRFQSNEISVDRMQTTGLCEVKHLLPTLTEVPEKSIYGTTLAYPGVGNQDHDRKTTSFLYHALIFLERQLNEIRGEIYGDEILSLSGHAIRGTFQAREETVNAWKDNLPSGFRWDEKPSPSSDVMQARLSFMYWEAIRTINEPFLEYALYRHYFNVDGIMPAHGGKPLSDLQVRLYEAFNGMGDANVMLACNRCVRAAEQMTTLFDKESNCGPMANRCLIADAYVFLQHTTRTSV